MSALPRPINAKSDAQRAKRQHHEDSRRAVMIRCHGNCEVADCPEPATDWCHVAGRHHLVSEPLCSSPELTAGLCRRHHNALDRHLDPELVQQIRSAAALRLASAHGLDFPLDYEPLDAIRFLVRQLDARGEEG